MKQTKAKPKKAKKMRKGRNTQSLPKIHGSPERPREDEDDTNNSPQLLGEIDSVSSNGKETSIERKLSKPKPKKLKPIKRKTKKVNNLIPISITSADVHVEPERKVLY
mmetsp:Transcript_25639/g.25445  ORF Transcript_25639/g.25445 Transcript_25639/m.25445 type:complete len:108 (+) Transcript_25639:526-849(+)